MHRKVTQYWLPEEDRRQAENRAQNREVCHRRCQPSAFPDINVLLLERLQGLPQKLLATSFSTFSKFLEIKELTGGCGGDVLRW